MRHTPGPWRLLAAPGLRDPRTAPSLPGGLAWVPSVGLICAAPSDVYPEAAMADAVLMAAAPDLAAALLIAPCGCAHGFVCSRCLALRAAGVEREGG